MDFLQLNQLSEEQIQKIRELEQVCKKKEGLERSVFLSNEINFNTEIDCFYLLYDGEVLISFLFMFIPTADESEISAYTLPEHRHKGHFHFLLQKAGAELEKYHINKILFVHEPQGKDALAVLKHNRAEYAFSEYSMVYDRTAFRKGESKIRLELAAQTDIQESASISSGAFDEDYEESLSIITKSVASPNIQQYCAFLGEKMVGICNANLKDKNISIYGISISPEFRGNGYGRDMLNLLLERLIPYDNKEIILEVSSTNQVAYNLYITSGFRIRTQYDYNTYTLNS